MTEESQEDRPPAADIATAIGEALAQATETTGVGPTEDATEIRAITEAMVRLLVGVPLRSDGQLTIKSLAEEADLRRNLAKADLIARVDELTRHNDELAASLAQHKADNQQLHARVTEMEDDLAAARTSLRRMIRAENLPTDNPAP